MMHTYRVTVKGLRTEESVPGSHSWFVQGEDRESAEIAFYLRTGAASFYRVDSVEFQEID